MRIQKIAAFPGEGTGRDGIPARLKALSLGRVLGAAIKAGHI